MFAEWWHQHCAASICHHPGIINQKTAISAGQGLINPNVYAMAKANLKNLKAVGINDILSKNNAYSPVPGYAAHKGYDLFQRMGRARHQSVRDLIHSVRGGAGDTQK